ISNGSCTSSSSEVTITRNQTPTVSNAGSNQTQCETATATLAGNAPTVGTGTWTLVSGAGTITTPSSNTSGVTALGYGANVFRWTISNGSCTSSSSEVTITRNQTPTASNAGSNQTQCETATATLAGNAPTVGTGTWTLVSGTGTITTPSSNTSGVTALGYGANVFRWTISNGSCTSSTSDVTITRNQTPTASNAGSNQTQCETATATLAGNTPTVGTGTWTLVSGTGTITTPSARNSGVTALGYGANVFRWTISNGSCTSSSSDVTITRNQTPTASNAGSNQTQCETATATLAGNAPTVGTGTWTLVSGAGTITTPSSNTSGVTALGYGANVFRWTISNGSCTSSSSEVTITRNQTPTASNAGSNQTQCETATATLAGNAPTVGTGTWTLVSGAGTITTPSSNTSGVTALGYGANVFRWTISNGSCTSSSSEVTITRNQTPTASNAGSNQTQCETATATLAGNAPTVGTGTWTLVSGTGTITTPSSNTSGVTALGYGANVFRWTISNGSCTSSSSDVTITRDKFAGTASNTTTTASICETSTKTLSATPVGGTWSVISGGGSILGSIYTPDDVTGDTNVTIRYTVPSNGSCNATQSDVTFIVYDKAAKPLLSLVSQPNCSTETGSFSITNYNSNFNYIINPSVGVVRSAGIISAPSGSYTIKASINNCESEETSFVVNSQICAVAETLTPNINGFAGGNTTMSLIAGDKLNGVQAVIGNSNGQVTIAEVTVPNGFSINPDGTVKVSANTVAGDYNIVYRICEYSNSSNCSEATSVVRVSPAVIDAVADALGTINGNTGGTTTISLINSDTLNAVQAVIGSNPGQVKIEGVNLPTGISIANDGKVVVAPNTPAGSYDIEYKICEITNPLNCDSAIST
ncbi:hypothetical protein K6T82_24005, partial [Flavobacterium sp. 17A]